MRDKNNRISFAFRDLLSKTQEVFGGKAMHNAICRGGVNGEYFDLVRNFFINSTMTLSLYIREDNVGSKKGFYFEIEKDISMYHLDIKEIKVRSKTLNYNELGCLLNALGKTKGKFVDALLNNEIRHINKYDFNKNKSLVYFNDFFDVDFNIFFLEEEDLKNRIVSYFLKKYDGKASLENIIEEFEHLVSEKEDEVQKLNVEINSKEDEKLVDLEYLALLKQQKEIQEKIAKKEIDLFGNKRDQLSKKKDVLSKLKRLSRVINKESLKNGKIHSIEQNLRLLKNVMDNKTSLMVKLNKVKFFSFANFDSLKEIDLSKL